MRIIPVLLFFIFSCLLAEAREGVEIVDGTVSPDKKTAVARFKKADGSALFCFFDLRSRKKLGSILPPDQEGRISNVCVETSWNKEGSKVALLIFYGTKLSEVFVYTKSNGSFKAIDFKWPDPIAEYNKAHHKHLSFGAFPGVDENALGCWMDESRVRLLAGTLKDTLI